MSTAKIYADDAALPCESLIDYDDFIIRVPEAQVESTADYIRSWLAARSSDQLRHHCLQARKAWEAWLKTDRLPAQVAYELGQKCKIEPAGSNAMNPPRLLSANAIQESAVTSGPAQLVSRKQKVCSASAAIPIDIILLTYNRLNYFQQTLQALVNNTRYPYRLIVVDNCSGPEMRLFIQEYADLFDHVVLNDKNYFTAAFQRGIACATSDPYIVSDPDILVPDLPDACWLERLITLHTSHPEMGLIALNLDPTNKPAKLPDVYIGAKTTYNADITLGNVGTVMQSIKRRYFDGRYLTDWETCDQIRANGGKVGFATGIVGWHLGWDEDKDYPDYLIEKYDYFRKKYGAETYRMYTEKEELLSRMATTSIVGNYYAYSRPDVQRLINSGSQKILDVGCGAGMLGASLKQKAGVEVWGVEYVPEVAQVAAGRLDHVIATGIEDALAQLPDGYFDTIICADVLEHLVDPWQVLSDLKQKLAPDGEVVASIPNIRHWSVVSKLLEGRWEYADAGLLDRTHLRFFTRHDCIRMFEKAGYRINQGEATMLDGDNGIPEEIVATLGKAGLSVSSLSEESRLYQFLIKASPYVASVRKGNGLQLCGDKSSLPQSGLMTIVILTFNQLWCTKECVESIQQHTPETHEIIFVDNGSTDGTVDWLREQVAQHDNYRLIENGKNLGFAKGCNQGIEAAGGEYILLLNNDVVVTTDWLAGLLECYRRKPHVGIVGPMTNNISGIQRVADVGYDNVAGLDAFARSFREHNRYRMIENRRIVGFCMLFSKQLANKVGLLDETFGSGNFEDDDYCLRAELAGYRNYIAGDVFIHHYGSQTFAGNKMDYGQAMQDNMTLYRQKWNYKQLDEALLRRLIPLDAVIESRRLVQQGEIDKAVEVLLQKGIKIAPDATGPYKELAELLLGAGRYQDALEVLPEMPPEVPPAQKQELAAVCHCALGDEAAASKAAIEAGGQSRALVVLGTLAVRQSKQSEAEALFRQAIQADPSYGNGWLALGMLLWGQGRQEEAWQAVDRAVTVDPLHNEALTIFSDMGERLNRQTDVCRLLEQAVQLYPLSRQLTMQYAQMLNRTGQYAEGLAVCERFLVQFGVDGGLLALALELRERSGAYDRLQQGGSESVSLCMIVKNEEAWLARCLASAKPVVHEMIVVDTGSTDTTVAIATAFGAKVHHVAWNGNFSDARNYSLQQASGAWILVLDADEVIATQDYPKIQQAITSAAAQKVAWSVVTRNYTQKVHAQGWTANDGLYLAEERADGWHPSTKVRLFPSEPAIRFVGEIHEMVEPALQAGGIPFQQADFVVHHYGELKDESAALQKKQRYYELGKAKLLNNPANVVALIELGVQAGELGLYQEAIDYWDRVLAIDPACVEALFNKGYALMGLKRYTEALELARETLRLEPLHKEAGFNYGTCALYAGVPAEALQLLGVLARRYPDYPPLLAISVVLNLAVNQLTEASRCHAKLAAMRYAIDNYVAERAAVLQSQPNQAFAAIILKNWEQIKAPSV